jgi:hypothetical protein
MQQRDRPIDGGQPPLRFALTLPEFPERVGIVLLDGSEPQHLEVAKHEFILLSETLYFGLDGESPVIDDYPLYLVMLVGKDPKTKIAKRLGLGRVYKTAWEMALPGLELVVLG